MTTKVNETEKLCRHFGTCGGCQHQDLTYEQQLDRKAEALAALFAPFWSSAIDG